MKQEPNQFYFNTLPKATLGALERCSEMDFFSKNGWYLAGGTALALQSGHRRSVDLGFFTAKKTFEEKKAEETMSGGGGWVTTSLDRATLYGEFFGAKISLIAYPFFKPKSPMRKFGTVSILTPKDIAVMKIIAISQRGRKRDFFDLYWICQNTQSLSLQDNIAMVRKQYSIHQNLAHILKSLVYFEDAENDPEPEIFFKADWDEVKDYFNKEMPTIAKNLMGLN